MSRIIGATLLLIMLVDSFYHSTASRAGLHVPKGFIRKCRCKVSPGGKIKCPYPLFPTNIVQLKDLVKCLCSETNQHKFPKFQGECKYRSLSTPL